MDAKLYQITDELAEITDSIIDAEGVISPELEKRLDECNMTLVNKSQGIRKVLSNIDANNNAIDAEIKRLKKLKEVRVNAKDRLKAYIIRCMREANLEKIETPLGNFTNCKGKETAREAFYNSGGKDTPHKYRRVIPKTWQPDKVAILNALKEGKKVRGWKIQEGVSYLKVT